MARDLGVRYSENTPYYFMSYSSEDEQRVSEYAKALETFRVPMWYDRGIKVGEHWEFEIAERIENCEAVIMFISKSILNKECSYVHKEFELAAEYSQKTIYIIMLDEIKKPDVPIRFRTWWTSITKLQCINAFECDSPQTGIKKLVESAGLIKIKENESDTSVEPPAETEVESTDNEVFSETASETESDDKASYIQIDEATFYDEFGLPPVVKACFGRGEEWKKQISQMNTEDILKIYNNDDYCAEYRYYCYAELKTRLVGEKLDTSQQVNSSASAESDKPTESRQEETGGRVGVEDDIAALLGDAPVCTEISDLHDQWKQQISELLTHEIFDRYNSEEWCDEYRLLCYRELAGRDDLEKIVYLDQLKAKCKNIEKKV